MNDTFVFRGIERTNDSKKVTSVSFATSMYHLVHRCTIKYKFSMQV